MPEQKKKKKDCKAQLHDYAALGIPNAGNSREERLTEWELLAIKKILPDRIFPLRRQLFALTMLKEAHMAHDKLNV